MKRCPYCAALAMRVLPTCPDHADLIVLDPDWWDPEAQLIRSLRGYWLERYTEAEIRDLAVGLELVAA